VGPKAGTDNFGEERNILAMTEIEPIFLGRPAHSLVRGELLIRIKFLFVLGVHCFRNR
jgi:hypothetical protein